MDATNGSPARELMMRRLSALSKTLQKRISDEILPRLKDERLSAKTKLELEEKLNDLRKSLSEIAALEVRLERL
ncbi:MAG TPA: hypothetical protein V6C97_02270 [Oculatellaceae cyanobacterium]